MVAGYGWHMNLAPGGHIRQRIHRDENPEDVWATSAETLLNIQILNSVAFESVTRMVTPPTPVSFETYAKAGLPFFKEYTTGESAESGGLGSDLKSVQQIDNMKGVRFGDSVASGSAVGCMQCKRNLCDCILRPCNHSFCSSCVKKTMINGMTAICSHCQTKVELALGFSAPMTMPGQEEPTYVKEVQLLEPLSEQSDLCPTEMGT
ncbi:uncharacterized protein BJX67DRAFT_342942 [Aspergillus lucknowensis]|uniref:RING-type domain-containing protein n=1 Tax=Aspergillus lucknowensis TaxID=176173 RepID=A0ABR4M5A7_9EURO